MMTREPGSYRGNHRLLVGIILGVLAFWVSDCTDHRDQCLLLVLSARLVRVRHCRLQAFSS